MREELAGPLQQSAPASLTVAICTRDHPQELRRCLLSLLELRPDDGGEPRSFDVLVVDNAPCDDATRRLVSSLEDVQYAREPRPGLDFARNRAFRETRTDFVAYLDDDVVVDPGWLVGLEEALAEHPDAAVVTGAVLPLELVTEAQIIFERRGGFRRGFAKIRYQGQRLPGNPLYPCGAGMFGAGCNMVVRTEALEALGGFDEALDTGPPLPGGGDLDLFYRIVRAGYPLVYEPRMLVFHRHRRELRDLRRQFWTWGAGLAAFSVKSYLSDPERRGVILKLYQWWVAEQLRELRRSVRGKSVLPPSLVLAELVGGIVGLTAYHRSVRRVAGIRRTVP